jgi:hypothetical protein
MAVFSLIAAFNSSCEKATTNFPPAARMALSNEMRPPNITTSCFMPVVSGNCQILAGSVPAMQAAVATAIAAAAPEVTIPDSAPESSARRFATPRSNSHMSTKCKAASCLAAFTSGSSSEALV